MMFQRFGGKASVTDFINGGGVCWSALATPGLVIIYVISVFISDNGHCKKKLAVKYRMFFKNKIFALVFFSSS